MPLVSRVTPSPKELSKTLSGCPSANPARSSSRYSLASPACPRACALYPRAKDFKQGELPHGQPRHGSYGFPAYDHDPMKEQNISGAGPPRGTPPTRRQTDPARILVVED